MIFRFKKIFFNISAEIEWLDSMMEKGYFLKKCSFNSYWFEKKYAAKFKYWIEILEKSETEPEMREFICTMETMGFKKMAVFMRIAYFIYPYNEINPQKVRKEKINKNEFKKRLALIGLFCILNIITFVGSVFYGLVFQPATFSSVLFPCVVLLPLIYMMLKYRGWLRYLKFNVPDLCLRAESLVSHKKL